MPVIASYGGTLIIGDFELKQLEGSPLQGVVVVQFESVEAAERFYRSPEYTKHKNFALHQRMGGLLLQKNLPYQRIKAATRSCL